ncbi:hypothetical protein FU658_09810 [Alkalisalibacterium limincola]|uniref:Uncharacterized protein n=2 Tax=Alkalisalibacterium limincola TaxID=2699169 RepID=A0A5C8KS17_9GAMM|nr:hypothetical protein FU658_09810 [Alkalisalibacterium limincola]
MRLRRRLMAGGTLVLMALIFVSALVISGQALRGARIDLTENRIYTVSEGTRQIVAGLEEPVSLYLFFSESAAADYPALRTYAQRVRELLQEIAARSGGKVRLEVIDPLPFSEAEDRATAFGLEPVPVGTRGQSLFLGLAGTGATGAETVIPFFQPDKEAFLEYDVAKLIQSLSAAQRPVVGMMSTLSMGPGFDPGTGQVSQGWVIDGELRQLFELRRVERDVDSIDLDIDLLVVVHPKGLSEAATYAIDQFVLGGGRLVVFVDPYAESDPDGLAASLQAQAGGASSDLPRLFEAWGVRYDPGLAVLDAITALQVQASPDGAAVRHPALLGLGSEQFNREDIVTADLQALNFASSGYFDPADGEGLSMEPLVQSSAASAPVDVARLYNLDDPDRLFDDFQPRNRHHALAVRLSGRTRSAFPEHSGRPGHLAESLENANIVLVADTDLLSDRLWVQARNFAGQRVTSAFADNGNFVVNTIDNLLGSDELISVRTRPTSQRPFTVVESLRRMAEDRFRSKERELQAELLETERRLAALQAEAGAGGAMPSGVEEAEVDRFQAQLLQLRRELREVRFQLDADIDALGARLKAINIIGVPLLVTVFALGFAFWRARQRRRAIEGTQ